MRHNPPLPSSQSGPRPGLRRASSPQCTVWKDSATAGWAAILALYVALGVLVAMPTGTPAARRCCSSRAAPGSSRAVHHLRRHMVKFHQSRSHGEPPCQASKACTNATILPVRGLALN